MSIKDKIDQQGVAALVLVIIISSVMLLISTAIASTNLVVFQGVEGLINSRRMYYLSESGSEDSMVQLENDLNYMGSPYGEVTPVGTYYSSIDNLGDNYTISSWAQNEVTYRRVNFNVNISFSIEPVTTQATYMADYFVLSGVNSKVRGNVWTNDDFEIARDAVLEGNLTSLGRGSQAVNWVWDGVNGGNPSYQGGRVIDNPETAETEGNLLAYDSIKVSGPNSYVSGNAYSNDEVQILYGAHVYGEARSYAGITFEEIPVPIFDYDLYKEEAIAQGTYFNNGSSFESYVASLDNGVERRLPEDLYYVANGAVKFVNGTPVYFDGLLVVEEALDIYCEWHQTRVNNLPAIIGGKEVRIANKYNTKSKTYEYAGPVRISGVVYAEHNIELMRTFGNEDIFIDGAVWSGDDIFIKTNSFVKYNADVQNVQGFGFASGITGVEKVYWQEDLSY